MLNKGMVQQVRQVVVSALYGNGVIRVRGLTLMTLAWLSILTGVFLFSGGCADALTLHKYEPPSIESVPANKAATPGALQEANAITVYEENLYVAEHFGQVASDSRTNEFGPTTSTPPAFISQLSQSSLSGLVEPDRGIAFGESTGETEMYLGVGKNPAGIAAFGIGLCGTLECASFQKTWTGANVPGGSFTNVRDIAVDDSTSPEDWAQGDVFVVDDSEQNHSYVVDVLRPEAGGKEPPGLETQLTGISPSSHFGFLEHVAVSGFNGDVVIQDDAGIVDVFKPVKPQKAGEKGTYSFVDELVPPSGSFFNDEGQEAVAVDNGDGEIYVATGSAVYEFSSEGVYLGKFTGEETREHTNGPVWSYKILRPVSVAVDPTSHRVFVGVYEKDGAVASINVFGPDVVIPDVVTGSTSNVDVETGVHAWSVGLTGDVNPDSTGAASCWFAWGTSKALGNIAPCQQSKLEGGSLVPVSAELKGLAPGTTYYYRLQASNENGTNTGEEETQAPCEGTISRDGCFTTPGPSLSGESVSAISSSSSKLEGMIDPRGSLTSYHFEYDTTAYTQGEASHGTSVPSANVGLGSGMQGIEVSQPVQGLQPNTEYHYRVVAKSEVEITPGEVAAEEFDGPDQTFVTQRAGGPLVLSDGRKWELVSPADKHGGVIPPIGSESVEQASVEGDAFTYQETASIEPEPQGNTELSQVFTSRDAEDGGWSSRDIAMPHGEPVGVSAGQGEEYRFFSEDLTAGIVEPFGTFSEPESKGLNEASPTANERTPYLRSDATCAIAPMTCYTPLLTDTEGFEDVLPGTEFGGNPSVSPTGDAHFVEATPDATHVVLSSAVQLTPVSAPKGGLYVWSITSPVKERLQLVSILPGEAEIAAEDVVLGGSNLSDELLARHAISNNGSRIFFSTEGEHQLYMRDTAEHKTIRLDIPEGESGSGEKTGGAVFQIANAEGSKVFFMDKQPLTKNAGKTKEDGDLYECEIVEITCHLNDLTPVPGKGQPGSNEEANMQGAVLGASEDGDYVYFVADGVQANGAEPGDCKVAGEPTDGTCNLYVRHDGKTVFISTLSGDDSPDWSTQLSGMTSRVSPNGQWLAFMSDRPLTGYNNNDAISGMPDEEVYLYNAVSDSLVCASCNPTGARPVGTEYKHLNGGLVGGDRVWPSGQWLAANIPGWTAYGLLDLDSVYQSRYLSNEGRLFFDSGDALVAQDTNGEENVYEYEPVGAGGPAGCSAVSVTFGTHSDGCVGLVSSGVSAGESAFLDASGSGGDVFFLTSGRLVSEDVDSSLDLYDAHECTNILPCPAVGESAPEECKSAATCRAAPAAQPSIYGAPASVTFVGAGNIATTQKSAVKEKRLTRAEKLVRDLKSCKRDKIKRRRAACERQARKQYGPVKASKKSRSRSKSSAYQRGTRG
jgi:hypothetical protein